MKNNRQFSSKNATLLALTLTALTLSPLDEAYAFTWFECNDTGKPMVWSNSTVRLYLSENNFPAGSEANKKAQYAMSAWNRVGGSGVFFRFGRYPLPITVFGNGRNEIAYEHKPEESYLAVTHLVGSCSADANSIDEADVILNSRYTYTTANYTGADFSPPAASQELVLLHELGHVLGLGHYNTRLATMNTLYPGGGTLGYFNWAEPHGDDRRGVRIFYPDATTERNVSASRFQKGKDIEGATDLNNVLLTVVPVGSPTLRLRRGERYEIEYTVENLGTQVEVPKVNFYLSRLPSVSVDSPVVTYLGSSSWIMSAGTTVTAKRSMIVPADQPLGKYYVGYIVDPDKLIPEINEHDNALSLLRKVDILPAL